MTVSVTACGAAGAKVAADGAGVDVTGPAGSAVLQATSTNVQFHCAFVIWTVRATAQGATFILASTDFVAVDAKGQTYEPIPEPGEGAIGSADLQRGASTEGFLFFGTDSASGSCPENAPPSSLTLEYKPYGSHGVLAKWPQVQPAGTWAPSGGYVPIPSEGAYG